MMITFITFNSNLIPLIEGLCCSNPCELKFSVLDGIEPMIDVVFITSCQIV